MKIISTDQMRDLDRRTIENYEIPGKELMDRAGLGIANAIDRLFDRCEIRVPSILLIAGRGNNGGDAFAAAYYLKSYGFNTTVWLAGSINDINGDAQTHLDRMKKEKISIDELPTKEDWDLAVKDRIEARWSGVDVIVDGVLGTGIKGPARGPAAGAISYINSMREDSLVLAIDVPSGLDSDTGRAEGDAVAADITVTMGLPKQGLVAQEALDRVGQIDVVDIGIPRELVDQAESRLELITASDIRCFFRKRPRDSHKGGFGHLLFIGGAEGYSGAAALAVMAAVRSGAGLVTALVPRSIAAAVSNAAPEAMVRGMKETEIGSLASECWSLWRDRQAEFSAVLAGPGMTRHSETGTLLSMILSECPAPVIMDADALNVFEDRSQALRETRYKGGHTVLTPHPREMARLLGCSCQDVQADRFGTALSAADKTGAVVVLKGAGTLVAERDRPLNINMTGNPGMARGGMGDVLAGLLGGLVARGLAPFDAARSAVFLHGLAGDKAAKTASENGMTAGDVITSIPFAFKSVTVR